VPLYRTAHDAAMTFKIDSELHPAFISAVTLAWAVPASCTAHAISPTFGIVPGHFPGAALTPGPGAVNP
jgi:hypothetical protein